MKNNSSVIVDKETFRKWIVSCCNSFLENEDELYNLFKNGSASIEITFPIRIDEIPTMEIVVNKIIKDSEDKVKIIQYL